MRSYNKLVRDNIPDIINNAGKTYSAYTLSEEAYEFHLRKKAQEELNEYFLAVNEKEAKEELADLLEIIYAFADLHNLEMKDIEKERQSKLETRGGFKKKIFLEHVEE